METNRAQRSNFSIAQDQCGSFIKCARDVGSGRATDLIASLVAFSELLDEVSTNLVEGDESFNSLVSSVSDTVKKFEAYVRGKDSNVSRKVSEVDQSSASKPKEDQPSEGDDEVACQDASHEYINEEARYSASLRAIVEATLFVAGHENIIDADCSTSDLAKLSTLELGGLVQSAWYDLRNHNDTAVSHHAMVILKQIGDDLNLALQKQPFGDTPKRRWIVPHPRDPEYCESIEWFGQAERAMSVRDTSCMPILVIHGPCGTGKTAVAIEIAYRAYANSLDRSVFWIDAHSAPCFQYEYGKLAELLEIPSRVNSAIDRLQVVKEWLSKAMETPWLIVIDSFGNDTLSAGAQSIAQYIPERLDCFVIFTSRLSNLSAKLRLQKDAVIDFPVPYVPITLQRGSRRLDIAKEIEINHISRAIAKRFKQHSLVSTQEFQSLCNDAAGMISSLAMDSHINSESSRPIIIITILMIRWLKKHDRMSFGDACMASLFDNFNIPFTLLRRIQITTFERYEAGMTLIDYDLMYPSEEPQYVQMSPLVQMTIRNWLQKYEPKIDEQMMEAVLGRWSSLVNILPPENFPSLAAHVETMLARTTHGQAPTQYYRASLFRTMFNGRFFAMRWKEAEPPARQAYELYLKLLGPESATTIFSKNAYGLAKIYIGEVEEARGLLGEAQNESSKSLGQGHFATWIIINNITSTEKSLKDLKEEMEDVYLARSKVLGDELVDYCTSPDATAYQAYAKQMASGKDIEPDLAEMLCVIEQRNGSFHHRTATINHYFGRLLLEARNYDAAETHFRKAVDAHTCCFGANDLMTLTDAYYLALNLFELKKTSAAEKLLHYVYDQRSNLLGHQSTQTMLARDKLTDILQAAGRLDEAEPILQSALHSLIGTNGKANARTLQVVEQLYLCYIVANDPSSARELCHHWAPFAKQAFGFDSKENLAWLTRLAWAFVMDDRLGDAAPLLHRSVTEPFIHTLNLAGEMATLYLDIITVFHKAQLYLPTCTVGAQVLALREQWFGPEHKTTLNALKGMYNAYRSAGKRAEAIEIERVLAERTGESSDFLDQERSRAVERFQNIVENAGGEIVDPEAEVLVIRAKGGKGKGIAEGRKTESEDTVEEAVDSKGTSS